MKVGRKEESDISQLSKLKSGPQSVKESLFQTNRTFTGWSTEGSGSKSAISDGGSIMVPPWCFNINGIGYAMDRGAGDVILDYLIVKR